jgi:hypothetical protein
MLLLLLTQAFIVPAMIAEELLEGTHGCTSPQGDGFDTLAGQVGEQSGNIGT